MTEPMTTEKLHNFSIGKEDFEIVRDVVYLGSTIHPKGDGSQEIRERLRFGRAAMKESEKIAKGKDGSLETKDQDHPPSCLPNHHV